VPKLTRRNLLAKSGTGMAAMGVLGMSPGMLKVHGRATTEATNKLPGKVNSTANTVVAPATLRTASSSAPLMPSVVYIRDAAKGEVVFMVGTRQIVRTDRALVESISKAATQTA
jgi:hypothetical protein